jgi:hypothetical protein
MFGTTKAALGEVSGVCYNVDSANRANRPDQQTFCCVVCGYSAHADLNAAINNEYRRGNCELRACWDRKAVKALNTLKERET